MFPGLHRVTSNEAHEKPVAPSYFPEEDAQGTLPFGPAHAPVGITVDGACGETHSEHVQDSKKGHANGQNVKRQRDDVGTKDESPRSSSCSA